MCLIVFCCCDSSTNRWNQSLIFNSICKWGYPFGLLSMAITLPPTVARDNRIVTTPGGRCWSHDTRWHMVDLDRLDCHDTWCQKVDCQIVLRSRSQPWQEPIKIERVGWENGIWWRSGWLANAAPIINLHTHKFTCESELQSSYYFTFSTAKSE